MQACRVCGNRDGNTSFVAREMMFGWKDEFEYFHCGSCGCLQIAGVPADLSRYYPEHYYALKRVADWPLKRYLKRKWFGQLEGKASFPGRMVALVKGKPDWPPDWLRQVELERRDAVLDVGCGNGSLLLQMHAAGFTDLTGIDPQIDRDRRYGSGVRLFRRTLDQLTGPYRFAMLHHSLEHMDDTRAALQHLHRVLKPAGTLLIRTPVSDCYAWRTYGSHWVQLDAPRHLMIHSPRSIAMLAEEAGFELVKAWHDSTAFQFWGSIQCSNDIPLMDERSHAVNPGRSMFSRQEIEDFEAQARTLNQTGDGDQACFHFRSPPSKSP